MPQLDQRNANVQRRNNDNASDAGGGRTVQMDRVTPGSPGGGTLSNALFSGDHVLESIAKGTGTLRRGARGPAVRAVQQYLIGLGYNLGRAGADGDFGGGTDRAVRLYQKVNGLGNDGIIGKGTLGHMDKGNAQGPGTQQPETDTSQPGGGLPKDFDEMWEAHPHNYQDDPSQNYDSGQLQEDQGWDANQYSNTCAIRLSVMMNKLGGDYKLSRDKAEKAGIKRNRLPYSRKTGWYYILSAKEMWIYLEYWGGKAHMEYPARGRFRNASEFQDEFNSRIKKDLAGKKGIVAFDKIFGYSGTGHVDIFDGEKLSDASDWYPSRALKLWFV